MRCYLLIFTKCKAIAYMCEKGMITKHPIHPTNPCKGMQYEKVYTDSSTINGADD